MNRTQPDEQSVELADISPASVVLLNSEESGEIRELQTLGGSRHPPLQWGLSDRQLASLRCTPTSPLFTQLTHVSVLDISHNALRSLKGVAAFSSLVHLNASYNHLQVGDYVTLDDVSRLAHLTSLNLSHNSIHRMEFAEFGVTQSTRSRRSVESEATHLIHIDLSFNRLVKLPDLRVAPALEVLHLDQNLIEDLLDIENKLPLSSIHTLHLAGNRILHVNQLVPVVALAPTLRQLTVCGNPFAMSGSKSPTPAAAAPRWWRPVLQWLAPMLTSIDEVDLTTAERRITTQLFRERGVLTKSMLEMLNLQNRSALEAYVLRFCSASPTPLLSEDAELFLWQEEQAYLLPMHESVGTSATSLGGVGNSDTHLHMEDRESSEVCGAAMAARSGGDVSEEREGTAGGEGGIEEEEEIEEDDGENTTGVAPAAAAAAAVSRRNVEAAGAPKMRSSSPNPTNSTTQSGVFNSSLMSDARAPSNSNFGTSNLVVVVKAMQTKMKSLNGVLEMLWKADMVRRAQAAVVIQKYVRSYLARSHLTSEDAESFRFIRSQLSRAARGGYQDGPQMSVALVEVLQNMRSLEGVIKSMWSDLETYRGMARRERRKAAILIQKCYRGFASRKKQRPLKEGYQDFVNTLVPYVQLLQRAGRGMLSRRRVDEVYVPRHRLAKLELEVVALRQMVSGRLSSIEALLAKKTEV